MKKMNDCKKAQNSETIPIYFRIRNDKDMGSTTLFNFLMELENVESTTCTCDEGQSGYISHFFQKTVT